jgi:hypothetical protein
LKPPKAKGFELDFGKFVTSAGAEVIEAKDNWNYSRSLLFAMPFPTGTLARAPRFPVSKTETIGFQLVNGWNNVTKTTAERPAALPARYTKPKYTWFLNYYVGPENANTANGFRNLIDTTLLLTPPPSSTPTSTTTTAQNRDAREGQGDNKLNTWQGVAVAAHGQATAKSALTGRFEYFTDPNGFTTGTAQHLYEFTGTYEYKWVEGLLTRIEYRGDFSNVAFFHKDTQMVDQQSTLTVAFIAFFGPKR